jgi:hypothetical protein
LELPVKSAGEEREREREVEEESKKGIDKRQNYTITSYSFVNVTIDEVLHAMH